MTHPPSAEGIVLVDFDGTMYPWGSMFNAAQPLRGVPQAMRLLKKLGFTIGIFTSRLSEQWHLHEGRDPQPSIEAHRQYISFVCERDGIPFDFITAEKVPAVAYFDDKAYRVTAKGPLADVVFAFAVLEGYATIESQPLAEYFAEAEQAEEE